jgi:NADH:ubiquinone oxidoreductase subunit K
MPETYLLFSCSIALFVGGLVTLLVRRSLIFVLIGLELMLNGANLNLVMAGRLMHIGAHTELLSLFVLVVTVAEVAVAVAIVVQLYRLYYTADTERFNNLEG